MRRVWNKQEQKNKSQVWYILKSKDGHTEMRFSSFDMLRAYWKSLSITESLKYSWCIEGGTI